MGQGPLLRSTLSHYRGCQALFRFLTIMFGTAQVGHNNTLLSFSAFFFSFFALFSFFVLFSFFFEHLGQLFCFFFILFSAHE